MTAARHLGRTYPRLSLVTLFFSLKRLGGAIDSLYIMPVANSTRSHRESIAREMRLFHGKTGPRSAHAGGTVPRRTAPLRAIQRRLSRNNMNVCEMRLRWEGLNRPLSPWHFMGWGVQTLLCPTRACTLASGIFFSRRMYVRVEAVIFSVLRERKSQFLFKAVAFIYIIIYYIKGNTELRREDIPRLRNDFV